MNPFDIVTDISSSKKQLITAANEKEYNAFIVNRALSYFPDTLQFAQDMNLKHNADNLMQYDYLFHSIRKAKRFSKWSKKEKLNDVADIQEYFGYSTRKAEEALNVLTKEQVKAIKAKMDKGGTR
jgi:hypothetical protein